MALGSVYAHVNGEWKNPLTRNYVRIVGTLDLHSHIRYDAIKRYFEARTNTVNIGAGVGIMTFAFASRCATNIIGVVYDDDELQVALNALERSQLKNVTFVAGGLPFLGLEEEYYDQVLLIDVLEHIECDLVSLRAVNRVMKKGGHLIISVPTPNYPAYFGRDFARDIGHVRDGYTIETINALLDDSGFRINKWTFYTNALASHLCSFWYRRELPYMMRLILAPVAIFLSKFDRLTSQKRSCSIALQAEKQSNVVLCE